MTGKLSAAPILWQVCSTEEALRLKAILLEGEILGIALAHDVPKISKRMPDVVARARVRGIRDTLLEKIAEANLILRRRRDERDIGRDDSPDIPQ